MIDVDSIDVVVKSEQQWFNKRFPRDGVLCWVNVPMHGKAFPRGVERNVIAYHEGDEFPFEILNPCPGIYIGSVRWKEAETIYQLR